MANTTLYTAVTGIVVSGVAGPAVASWATRRASRQQFRREVASRRRDDLRSVLDHAAELLSVGATNFRMAADADQANRPPPPEVTEWAGQVHVLEQRLLLRLPAGHPVVVAYGEVRDALVALGTAAVAEDDEGAIAAFERARALFLEEARKALDAPVAEVEAT